MKAGLAVVVAVASASVNTHVKVETVNFDEDQLNTEKNITETFAWKEKGPGEGKREVLDLTKLNNNKLSTFWEELTKTKELVLKNTHVFKHKAKTYMTNYEIFVQNKGESSGKLGAGFSLKYDENKYTRKLYLSLSDTSTDETTSALALYAMVSWALKEKGTLTIEQKENTEGYEEYYNRVSSTLGPLKLEG